MSPRTDIMDTNEMSDNPLLKALPPATDYLTYLTLLEYNLTRDQLPVLHGVLQDQTLTSNIGWDLVHLLLPLLPAADQCLQDVARLGNPREVVLKVTESLRDLPLGGDVDNEKDPDNNVENEDSVGQEDTTVIVSGGGNQTAEGSHHAAQGLASEATAPSDIPLNVRQFNSLVSMLSILQPRIKTNFPSRFLSTSLRAVLRAYAHLAWSAEATASVLQLVKILSGQKRPTLPPRQSSLDVRAASSQPSAPDPEAQSDLPTTVEKCLEQRLLQSFTTHVLEDCMSCMPSSEDIVGLAWTSRLQEKAFPEKAIPVRQLLAERFAESEELHARDAMVGQIVVRYLLG